MAPDDNISDITHTIQLAVAPVFLLSALGTILGVLANRLGRIVDRTRVIDDRLAATALPEQPVRLQRELTLLHTRRGLINYAITCATMSALLVCLLVAFAFVGFILHYDFSHAMAVLFVAAIGAVIAALILFLREVLHAVVSSYLHDGVL